MACANGQNIPPPSPDSGVNCPPEKPLYDTANGCQAVTENPDFPLCPAGVQRSSYTGECDQPVEQQPQGNPRCEDYSQVGTWPACSYPSPPGGGGYGYCGLNDTFKSFALAFKPYFAFWDDPGCGGGGGSGDSGGGGTQPAPQQPTPQPEPQPWLPIPCQDYWEWFCDLGFW